MTDKLYTWPNFKKACIDDGLRQRVVVKKDLVEFYHEPTPSRIGLRTWCDVSSDEVIELNCGLKLRHIEVFRDTDGGQSGINLFTRNSDMFEAFFSLMRDIADRIAHQNQEPRGAVRSAVDEMRRLGAEQGVMSEPAQHGLFGELLLLEMLLDRPESVDLAAWTGPRRDVHDFRLAGGLEVEVKTCLSAERKHWISSMVQLRASPAHDLYILSVQLCTSEEGRTLPDLVESVISKLDTGQVSEFKKKLSAWGEQSEGYREDHTIYYGERLQLRTPLALVPVGGQVPALTPALFVEALGKQRATRLKALTYEIDIDGLGFEQDSDEFNARLGLKTDQKG